MCKPSCCKPHNGGIGLATAALIIGAGIIVARIGHTLVKVAHEVIEVVWIAILVTAALAAAAVMAWIVITLVRWWLGHRQAPPGQARPVVTGFAPPHGSTVCVACGGLGEVLRVSGDGEPGPRPCPECHPARLAG